MITTARKISEGDARLAVQLCEAIKELPRVRKSLTSKPRNHRYSTSLQLAAAEMSGGEMQGSDHYFYLPPPLGLDILDAVENILLREMARLNVKRPKT